MAMASVRGACLAVLLLGLVRGEEAPGLCVTERQRISSLEAKVAALETELEKSKASVPSGAHPYVTSEVLERTLETLTHFAGLAVESGKAAAGVKGWNTSDLLTPMQSATDASYDAARSTALLGMTLSREAGAAALTAAEAGRGMAVDLHRTHVEPHIREYLTAGEDAYTTRIKPHVDRIWKVCTESGHSLASALSAALAGAALNATETALSLTASLSEAAAQSSASILTTSANPWKNAQAVTAELLAPRQIEVWGRTFHFPRGWLDMGMAVAQVAALAYLGFVSAWVISIWVVWKLFLKSLVWRVGVKLFGKKFVLGLATRGTRLSLSLTRLLARTALGLFSEGMRACICLAVGFLLAQGTAAVLGMGLGMALSHVTRICLGLGLGVFLLAVNCACRCCCRRAQPKKSVAAGKSHSTAKAQGAAKTNGVAKTAAPVKSNGVAKSTAPVKSGAAKTGAAKK